MSVEDEVEQRRSGLRPDVALQRGDRRLGCARSARRRWPDRSRSVPGGAAGRRARRGPSSGSDGMKSPRSRTVCSASRISGSDLPDDLQEARAARGRGQARVTSTNSLPPASCIGARGRQLPHREPQGLHGVGHHLLVTDGEVDVVLLVAGLGDGEQRGDRPALDDLEPVVGQAPFDVLGAAEVRLDPPAQLREPQDLRVRQRGCPAAPARSPVPASHLSARRGRRAAWWRPPWRRSRRRAP